MLQSSILKVLIVDDHILFREGLFNLLNKQPDMNVVGEAGSVHQAIEQARMLKPDVILMDYSMPDGTGLDASRVILAERPETKIVILTMHDDDDELLIKTIRLGIKGYLLKNIPTAKLIAALRGMVKGEAPISREMTARLITQVARIEGGGRDMNNPLRLLTGREMEVLSELAGGLGNREIAEKLVVAENTVRNHVHKILEKLELRSRREAAALARQNGLGPSQGDKKR